MPAYQAEQTVGGAIASVLTQTYPDLELILVDDGSTDATADIAAAHRGPIRIVGQENTGVATARNRGIEEAGGELIAFCDADDLLFPRHVEALVEEYDRSDRIVTANSYWLFAGGIHPSKLRYRGRFPSPESQRRAILEQNFVSTMSLFPRTLVDEIGPFDVSKRRAEDWDFWLRAIFAGRSVSLQREPLSLYRWGATGLSADREEMDAEIDAIFAGIEERHDLTKAELEYVRRRRAGPGPRRLSRAGDEALRAGRYREAARSYREAAALCPSERPLVWKARVLGGAPTLFGPIVRARQLRIEQGVGLTEDQIR
jgi:glycosyltransferase involved in cell wall biosynthesis